jgi:hypothetical protein
MARTRLLTVLLASLAFESQAPEPKHVGAATGGSSSPAVPSPRAAAEAERLVLSVPEVMTWSDAVARAVHDVAFRETVSQENPKGVDVDVDEEAGARLTRFGTRTICGATMHKREI